MNVATFRQQSCLAKLRKHPVGGWISTVVTKMRTIQKCTWRTWEKIVNVWTFALTLSSSSPVFVWLSLNTDIWIKSFNCFKWSSWRPRCSHQLFLLWCSLHLFGNSSCSTLISVSRFASILFQSSSNTDALQSQTVHIVSLWLTRPTRDPSASWPSVVF